MPYTVGKFTVGLSRGGESLTIDQNTIIKVTMTEDIFQSCMIGTLHFRDSVGYTEKFEITGFDPVSISYREEDIDVTKHFMVYDFNRIRSNNQGTPADITMKWHLIEIPFIYMNHHKYSKSWINKTGSDIIEEICKNMCLIEPYTIPVTQMRTNMAVGSDFAPPSTDLSPNVPAHFFNLFEKSLEKFEYFYMPYWCPLEAIRWLMRRSSGVESQTSGYLFFSNARGYNFVTLETLIKSKERELDRYGGAVVYINLGVSDEFNNILNWSINPTDMHSHKYLAGRTMKGFNFDNKELLDITHTYEDGIDEYTLLGKSSLFPNISKTNTNFTMECESDPDIMDNIFYNDFIKRYSKQFSMTMEVRGHSRRYAGMIIDVLWKSAFSKEVTNKMYAGLYLVRSITHQFTPGTETVPNYKQTMVCLKTGYGSDDVSGLYQTAKGKSIVAEGISKV